MQEVKRAPLHRDSDFGACWGLGRIVSVSGRRSVGRMEWSSAAHDCDEEEVKVKRARIAIVGASAVLTCEGDAERHTI